MPSGGWLAAHPVGLGRTAGVAGHQDHQGQGKEQNDRGDGVDLGREAEAQHAVDEHRQGHPGAAGQEFINLLHQNNLRRLQFS